MRNGFQIEQLIERLSKLPSFFYDGIKVRCGCPFHHGIDPNFEVHFFKDSFCCFSHGCRRGTVGELYEYFFHSEFSDSLLEYVGYYTQDDELDVPFLSEDTIRTFVGVHPYLLQRGYKQSMIEKFELGYIQSGKYKNRIMIPIRDHSGNLVSFKARAVGAQKPKYLGGQGNYKQHVLYGFFLAREEIERTKEVFLVEGEFDTIRLHQFGAVNTVGLMGKQLFKKQLVSLLQLHPEWVYLMLDNDNAGREATKKIRRQLRGLVNTGVIFYREKDPDSIQFSNLFWEYVERRREKNVK